MTTSTDLAKRALAEIGTRTTITSLIDGSTEANYANLLYAPLRDLLLRQNDYDWSMKQAFAVAAGVQTAPWAFSYTYPADAIRIRSVIPTTYSLYLPTRVEWNTYNAANIRYIVSNQAISALLYTFPADENAMDAIFQEALVRLLGSALAFALENRIEASKKSLEEALAFAGIADLRQP